MHSKPIVYAHIPSFWRSMLRPVGFGLPARIPVIFQVKSNPWTGLNNLFCAGVGECLTTNTLLFPYALDGMMEEEGEIDPRIIQKAKLERLNAAYADKRTPDTRNLDGVGLTSSVTTTDR